MTVLCECDRYRHATVPCKMPAADTGDVGVSPALCTGCLPVGGGVLMKRYVWRVTVTDTGGSDARPLIVGGETAVEMESETGGWGEVSFYPPTVGTVRHYLTKGGAEGRQKQWAENGVQSVIDRSNPVTWAADPTAWVRDR